MLKQALAEKQKMIPATGYNVVGVDTHEMPGSKLYLIGHYTTPDEAEKAKARYEAENPGVLVHVYDPTTK